MSSDTIVIAHAVADRELEIIAVPKGGHEQETGETLAEAAIRESWEEGEQCSEAPGVLLP